jgi:rubrerythrin
MALPVMTTPTYELVIPSTKQKVKFRPFLVKEEKALMIAQQSEDSSVMYNTLKSVANTCMFDKVDIDKLAMFDIEYVFCQLRAKSVGEESELVFSCLECNDPKGKTKINIDLSTLSVQFDENHKQNIDLFDNVGIKMKYPGVDLLDKVSALSESNTDAIFEVIVQSIDSIYTDDEVFPASEQTKQELSDFLENLTQEQFKKIQNFFETMPKLEKQLEFDCPNCGYHHKMTLQGLESFF